MASQVHYPLLTAEEFLAIDFGERKAELDNGVIRVMAGGTLRHSRVQTNIIVALGQRLRGTGCRPHGPDMAVRTRAQSVRYPEASVRCGPEQAEVDELKAYDDPRIVFEVLSAGTARTDLRVKLDEYKELPSIATIVFVDIAAERLRVIQRTGPTAWSDVGHEQPIGLPLPSLGIELPHDEIFARD